MFATSRAPSSQKSVRGQHLLDAIFLWSFTHFWQLDFVDSNSCTFFAQIAVSGCGRRVTTERCDQLLQCWFYWAKWNKPAFWVCLFFFWRLLFVWFLFPQFFVGVFALSQAEPIQHSCTRRFLHLLNQSFQQVFFSFFVCVFKLVCGPVRTLKWMRKTMTSRGRTIHWLQSLRPNKCHGDFFPFNPLKNCTCGPSLDHFVTFLQGRAPLLWSPRSIRLKAPFVWRRLWVQKETITQMKFGIWWVWNGNLQENPLWQPLGESIWRKLIPHHSCTVEPKENPGNLFPVRPITVLKQRKPLEEHGSFISLGPLDITRPWWVGVRYPVWRVGTERLVVSADTYSQPQPAVHNMKHRFSCEFRPIVRQIQKLMLQRQNSGWIPPETNIFSLFGSQNATFLRSASDRLKLGLIRTWSIVSNVSKELTKNCLSIKIVKSPVFYRTPHLFDQIAGRGLGTHLCAVVLGGHFSDLSHFSRSDPTNHKHDENRVVAGSRFTHVPEQPKQRHSQNEQNKTRALHQRRSHPSSECVAVRWSCDQRMRTKGGGSHVQQWSRR